jgi:hypothetical protein
MSAPNVRWFTALLGAMRTTTAPSADFAELLDARNHLTGTGFDDADVDAVSLVNFSNWPLYQVASPSAL